MAGRQSEAFVTEINKLKFEDLKNVMGPSGSPLTFLASQTPSSPSRNELSRVEKMSLKNKVFVALRIFENFLDYLQKSLQRIPTD